MPPYHPFQPQKCPRRRPSWFKTLCTRDTKFLKLLQSGCLVLRRHGLSIYHPRSGTLPALRCHLQFNSLGIKFFPLKTAPSKHISYNPIWFFVFLFLATARIPACPRTRTGTKFILGTRTLLMCVSCYCSLLKRPASSPPPSNLNLLPASPVLLRLNLSGS